MSKPLRPKRGTKEQNDAFTGLASEVTIDTDSHSIRVHDGVTAGGHEIPTKAMNDTRYVTSVNGNKGNVTPEQTGCVPISGGSMTGNLDMGSNSVVLNGKGLYGTSQGLAYGGDKVALGKDYLPLSGGTISGEILSDVDAFLKRSVSNAELTLYGGPSYLEGAYISLFGKDREGNPGGFNITTSTGADRKKLIGYSKGNLTWIGKEIERVASSGLDWIRYESGIQIIMLITRFEYKGKIYTFSVPFRDTSYVVIPTTSWGTGNIGRVDNVLFTSGLKTTTSCKIQTTPFDNAGSILLIGFWK